ncbi:MAG: DoxX-like family protein [Acidobacteriota bacterium]|nr:DoxX-like family protein [Acidobacteriota bacterium]
MKKPSGIYVEIDIEDGLEHVWLLTQDPTLHQRWDLRFSRIHYLPRPSLAEPQLFLYETRIGFGLSVNGTGESAGQRASGTGDTTSSLKFASADPKSLIREGSGYWRYVTTDGSLRFLTWYDYTVRFGMAGRLADRLAFRPLIGWATAWSFDRLRIWAETGQPPESTLILALIHSIARLSIAAIWIWHGLVPKLLYRQIDEKTMLSQAGLSLDLLPWIGVLEILFGALILYGWNWRFIFLANIALMVLATFAVAINSPVYLKAAFNPVTLNCAVIALSIVGWLSSATLASSRRCRRVAPKERQ